MPDNCCDDHDQLTALLDIIYDHVEAVDTHRLATLAAGLLARLLEDELIDWPTPRMLELVAGEHAELAPHGLAEEREEQLRSLLERLLGLLLDAAGLKRLVDNSNETASGGVKGTR